MLRNEMGALVKGTPESSLARQRHREKSPSKGQDRAVTRPRMRQLLDLRIPSFRNCERPISVLHKPLNLRYSVTAAPTA